MRRTRIRLISLVFMAVGFMYAGVAFAQVALTIQAYEPLTITQKPKPSYTDTARRKHVQGTVVVNVEFLANGEIGAIVDVTKKRRDKLQKYGLTGMAIDAARKMKFIPAKVNGISVTVIKTAEYTFTIY